MLLNLSRFDCTHCSEFFFFFPFSDKFNANYLVTNPIEGIKCIVFYISFRFRTAEMKKDKFLKHLDFFMRYSFTTHKQPKKNNILFLTVHLTLFPCVVVYQKKNIIVFFYFLSLFELIRCF